MKKILLPIQWTFILLFLTTLWTSTIFFSNYIVDPFGNRAWIAQKIYKPMVHERSEKYNYIFNQNNIQKYDCIILGNSRVMSIVPNTNEAIKTCYNFGVHTANNPEKLFILQEWLKRAPLKEVYIGNDIYTMHDRMNPLELKPHRFTEGSESNFLSFSTFKISIKVLENIYFNKPQTYIQNDGSIVYSQDEQAIQNGTFDHSYKHFTELSQNGIQGNFIQNPFAYQPKALTSLHEIKKLCVQKNIRLHVFITPTFYESQKIVQSNPTLKIARKRFQDDLSNIFGNVYDFDIDTPENYEPRNFYDSVHYRPIIGKLMVEKLHNHGNYGKIIYKQ